jgi:hypothetical protein
MSSNHLAHDHRSGKSPRKRGSSRALGTPLEPLESFLERELPHGSLEHQNES